MDLREELIKQKDDKYRDFQSKLLPNIAKESIIGVRVPMVRKLAKQAYKAGDYKEFLHSLPHEYYDENILHGQILNLYKDYDSCLEEIERFLPYVDNWAVCDLLSPKVLLTDRKKTLCKLKEWALSDQIYTSRFGLELIMNFYLEEDYSKDLLELAVSRTNEDYYMKMMVAWFMATALTFQWEDTVRYIEERKLEKWTHNKAIQKAVESYRITPEQKDYLKSLKIK